jgi:sigma-B regulation protein RsbU (phosphoserine phosphatase)
VTLLLVRIDPEHRCVQYAGAGHEPAYVVRASCEGVLTLPSMGPPLGLVRDLEYESSEPMGLEQGDTMLLLTDGVTESVTGEAAEFGPGGALDFVRGNLAGSAQELAGGICGAALAFAGGEQKDDLAAVVCRFTARA